MKANFLSQARIFSYSYLEGTRIIRQLEFISIYSAQNTGHISSDYLSQAYSGGDCGERIHSYIVKFLQNTLCSTAVIPVSRTNKRAVIFYKNMVGHI